MKKLFILFTLLYSCLLLDAQTTLMGRVTDENGDGLPYASVMLYKRGVLITGTETDSLGWYLFQDDPGQNMELDPGIYDVKTSYLGYGTREKRGVTVYSQSTNYEDFVLEDGSVTLETITVVDYKVPLISSDVCYCDCMLRQPAEEEAPIAPVGEKPSELSIFPNPASSYTTVHVPAATQTLTLFHLSGQPLRSWARLEQGPLSFSVSQLPRGSYVLVAETAEGSRHGKLVVAR